MGKLLQPLVDTGNVYDDILENIKQLYEDHAKELGVKRVYAEDPQMIDITPSIAQQFESQVDEEDKCLGDDCRQILTRINIIVWYYFEQIRDEFAKREATKKAFLVSNIIREHFTLNGFCTTERMKILSVNSLIRARASGFYNASRILVEVPKRFQVIPDKTIVTSF